MSFTMVTQGKRVFKSRKRSKADQALSLAKSNKRKINDKYEIVMNSVRTITTAFNAAPIITYLSDGGASFGSGQRIKITSVRVKAIIRHNLASDLLDDYRVDLVLDRTPNRANVTALDLYGSATPSIVTYKDRNVLRRFKILRSQFGVVNDVAGGPGSATIDWYVKLNVFTVTENDDSWAIADVTKNALFLVYWTTASANQPTMDCREVENYVEEK